MNTPLVIGALIVAVLVVFWLLSVIKTTIKTALFLGVVIFALQVIFRVGPLDLWGQVQGMAGGLAEWLRRWGNRYAPTRTPTESLLWFLPLVLDQISELG